MDQRLVLSGVGPRGKTNYPSTMIPFEEACTICYEHNLALNDNSRFIVPLDSAAFDAFHKRVYGMDYSVLPSRKYSKPSEFPSTLPRADGDQPCEEEDIEYVTKFDLFGENTDGNYWYWPWKTTRYYDDIKHLNALVADSLDPGNKPEYPSVESLAMRKDWMF